MAQSTYRPLNKCDRCWHTWYPRGGNVSRKCPACGSSSTGRSPTWDAPTEGSDSAVASDDDNLGFGWSAVFLISMLSVPLAVICLIGGEFFVALKVLGAGVGSFVGLVVLYLVFQFMKERDEKALLERTATDLAPPSHEGEAQDPSAQPAAKKTSVVVGATHAYLQRCSELADLDSKKLIESFSEEGKRIVVECNAKGFSLVAKSAAALIVEFDALVDRSCRLGRDGEEVATVLRGGLVDLALGVLRQVRGAIVENTSSRPEDEHSTLRELGIQIDHVVEEPVRRGPWASLSAFQVGFVSPPSPPRAPPPPPPPSARAPPPLRAVPAPPADPAKPTNPTEHTAAEVPDVQPNISIVAAPTVERTVLATSLQTIAAMNSHSSGIVLSGALRIADERVRTLASENGWPSILWYCHPENFSPAQTNEPSIVFLGTNPRDVGEDTLATFRPPGSRKALDGLEPRFCAALDETWGHVHFMKGTWGRQRRLQRAAAAVWPCRAVALLRSAAMGNVVPFSTVTAAQLAKDPLKREAGREIMIDLLKHMEPRLIVLDGSGTGPVATWGTLAGPLGLDRTAQSKQIGRSTVRWAETRALGKNRTFVVAVPHLSYARKPEVFSLLRQLVSDNVKELLPSPVDEDAIERLVARSVEDPSVSPESLRKQARGLACEQAWEEIVTESAFLVQDPFITEAHWTMLHQKFLSVLPPSLDGNSEGGRRVLSLVEAATRACGLPPRFLISSGDDEPRELAEPEVDE